MFVTGRIRKSIRKNDHMYNNCYTWILRPTFLLLISPRLCNWRSNISVRFSLVLGGWDWAPSKKEKGKTWKKKKKRWITLFYIYFFFIIFGLTFFFFLFLDSFRYAESYALDWTSQVISASVSSILSDLKVRGLLLSLLADFCHKSFASLLIHVCTKTFFSFPTAIAWNVIRN